MPRRLWTKEELIVTLALYFKLPFGRLNHTTREVIDLANRIGRTANSVALRLSNFAACDPYIINSGRHGMSGGLDVCMPIWREYEFNHEQLFYDAEVILARMQNQSIEEYLNMVQSSPLETERLALIKQRVNQDSFREMILNNYSCHCAISGISIPTLLVASHIIPWADNVEERLNPENGICLSPLYDKAFDKGLIGILPDYEIVISRELKEHSNEDFYRQCFAPINHTHILLPEEHSPRPAFLQYHYDRVFSLHD